MGVGFFANKPRGFAVRELLLVCLAIGPPMAGLFVGEPTNQAAQQAEPIAGSDVMIGREVPLGDEFVCTVGLVRYGCPD